MDLYMKKSGSSIDAAKPQEFYGEIAKTLPDKNTSRKTLGWIVAGYLWQRLKK